MITTPIGTITVTATPRGVSRVDLEPIEERHARNLAASPRSRASLTRTLPSGTPGAHAEGDRAVLAHVEAAERAIEAYFQGARDALRGIPIDPEGTPFQRTVWEALRTIPCGETISYRELAERIGNPSAVRAVGLANGRNPIPIVVPCHRVIGADGSLSGFGLGVHVKAWLLVHEGATDPLPANVTPATRLTRRPLLARAAE